MRDFYIKPEIKEKKENMVSIEIQHLVFGEGEKIKKETAIEVVSVFTGSEISIFINTNYGVEIRDFEYYFKKIKKIKKVLSYKEFKKADAGTSAE